jgi:hypothetical protein
MAGFSTNILGFNSPHLLDGLSGPIGTGPTAPAATSAKQMYYIQNLPPMLDKWGFEMAATFMRFWQSGTAFQRDDAKPPQHRTRVLDHDNLKGWTNTSKYPLDKLRTARPWLSTRKQDVINNIKKAWDTTSHPPDRMFFPDDLVNKPRALSEKDSKGIPFGTPSSNDKDWADAVDAFGLWNDESHGDGAGIWEIVTSSYDDYDFAIGRYDWFFLPKGSALLHPATPGSPATPDAPAIPATPDLLEVTISHVGVYARDSFDFNGNQFLGIWDVDAEKMVLKMPVFTTQLYASSIDPDCRYQPKMGYTMVGNRDFRQYRDVVKNGLDFIMYSDVKFFGVTEAPFSFELMTGKPV